MPLRYCPISHFSGFLLDVITYDQIFLAFLLCICILHKVLAMSNCKSKKSRNWKITQWPIKVCPFCGQSSSQDAGLTSPGVYECHTVVFHKPLTSQIIVFHIIITYTASVIRKLYSCKIKSGNEATKLPYTVFNLLSAKQHGLWD